MNPRTKRLINLGIILVTFGIVLYIVLSDPSLPNALKSLTNLRIQHIAVLLLCWALYVLGDAVSIWYCLRRQGYKLSLPYVYFTSICCQYYCGITPGATGGQPMQIYYIHKKGVPTGIASSALIVHFFCFQFMLFVLGTGYWIVFPEAVRTSTGYNAFMIFGYVYNIFTCGLIVTLSFFRPAIQWMTRKIVSLGAHLHLIKEPEETRKRWLQTVENFHSSMREMLRHPGDLLIQLVIAGLKLMALMSVAWFVYAALFAPDARVNCYGELITVDLMHYTTANFYPLPGASGTMEVFFNNYFGWIFGEGVTNVAMLIWRFFTYYFTLIVGMVVVTTVGLRSGKSLKEVASLQETAAEQYAQAEREEQQQAEAAEAAEKQS